MAKTKADRKAELLAIAARPEGTAKLRRIACDVTGRNPGEWPDWEIGSMWSDYIWTILDAEFPGDDSIPSDLQ